MSDPRYAIYYRPPEGAFASFGAAWLGWDAACAKPVKEAPVPVLEGPQEMLTAKPRKYGFHGTLKPPFRLAEGTSRAELEDALATLAATTAPASCDGLAIAPMGNFLALVPEGDVKGINRIARACVTKLDAFRAPATEAETAKRRKQRLTKRQAANLANYGYPHVLDDFHFHMTLTSPISAGIETLAAVMAEAVYEVRPKPFTLGEITLLAEDPKGRFHDLRRFSLTG